MIFRHRFALYRLQVFLPDAKFTCRFTVHTVSVPFCGVQILGAVLPKGRFTVHTVSVPFCGVQILGAVLPKGRYTCISGPCLLTVRPTQCVLRDVVPLGQYSSSSNHVNGKVKLSLCKPWRRMKEQRYSSRYWMLRELEADGELDAPCFLIEEKVGPSYGVFKKRKRSPLSECSFGFV